MKKGEKKCVGRKMRDESRESERERRVKEEREKRSVCV